MAVFIIIMSIVLLIVLISAFKVLPFLAFLVVSIVAALALGYPVQNIPGSIEKGIGSILSSLVILLTCGAMFGKIIAESGAAQKIAGTMMRRMGTGNIQWAMVLIGFIVGIPLFYGVGFVLMIPLIFSVVYKYKLPAVYIGLPMLAALSVTHGFLPPHPSPAALVTQFHANMGLTLLYGLLVAIPAIVIAGPLFARFLKNIPSQPLPTFVVAEIPEEELPGTFNSFFTALLPVVLLSLTAALPYLVQATGNTAAILSFFSSPSIVLLLTLGYATFSLGLCRGRKMSVIMDQYITAAKDIAPILLIIAGSGALKQVFTDTGLSDQIGQQLSTLHIEPLILGWLIAAVIRICVGSATVAGLTAAGIMLPFVETGAVNPNLMVLAIGAGSLACSHVNDSGFWMFKEYFQLSMKDTFRSWTVMESLVAIIGLAGVLVLNVFI